MLLWRMCRLFMRLREQAIGGSGSGADASNPTGTLATTPLTAKNQLRGLTIRIARVVAMMNRYGYRVTPQSGAMLQVSWCVGVLVCVFVCVFLLKVCERERVSSVFVARS